MKRTQQCRGYSLVELLVVLAIIGVVTVMAMTNQSSFNKTVILNNTAYDVALTIRSAEGYGVGSRSIGTNLNVAYGVHFDIATPGRFILFADTSGGASCAGHPPDCKPGDGVYTAGSDTIVQTYDIGNGVTIDKLCVMNSLTRCTSGTGTTISAFDITFTRPSLDATIIAGGSPLYYNAAGCLSLVSTSGTHQYVRVSIAGGILANYSSCP